MSDTKKELEKVNPITAEDFEQIRGKVFVKEGCYSIKAVQVVGHSRCFVRVREIPVKSEYCMPSGDGTNKIDWEWVDAYPIGRRRRGLGTNGTERYALLRGEGPYYLEKGRGTAVEFLAEASRDRVYHTVRY